MTDREPAWTAPARERITEANWATTQALNRFTALLEAKIAHYNPRDYPVDGTSVEFAGATIRAFCTELLAELRALDD